ncbi:MAG: cytotoxic translational repressor of toxin-antitoxin stability system [Leptolyngbyaceae cyanobacterium bins.349]|nr:cytotoxic translational repressor of toxin-antitoxin stability system [Leptolyngbyaceae cyanobacterium bins.349]
MKTALPWRRRTPLGLEVRYERSFLLDLQHLEPTAFRYIKQYVFEDFHQLSQLPALPAFRPIGSSGIFYRFTLDRYLIGLEVTGQLVKFLRIVPIPQE